MSNLKAGGAASKTTSLRIPWLGTDWDYWFDRETWSSLMGFLLISSAVLLIALPSSMDVGHLSPSAFEFADLFSAIYVILFGILAITQGQAEISWGHRLSVQGQFVHLMCRQLLAIGLSLPLWIFYLLSNLISPLMALVVAGHMALYSFVLGLFGWRLSLTHQTEIYQFNIKYLVFVGILVNTYLVSPLRVVNPIWVLVEMLNPTQSDPAAGLSIFYAVWIILGAILTVAVLRKVKEEHDELEGYENEISRHRE